MVRGLYTSASGMLVEMTRQDVISNNLANVNTTGFKRDITAFESFQNRLTYLTESGSRNPIGGLGLGVGVSEVGFNLEIGTFMDTGNKTDLAIGGDGFFVLQTPQGQMYTRNGHFSVNEAGQLVSQEGYVVQGVGGAITPGTEDFTVNQQGQVIVNGAVVGQLQMFFPTNPAALQKVGDNLFIGGGANAGGVTRIIQGKLEGSNVNPAREMIQMITAMRAYEANQRTIKAQDDILGKAVNEVGRVG